MHLWPQRLLLMMMVAAMRMSLMQRTIMKGQRVHVCRLVRITHYLAIVRARRRNRHMGFQISHGSNWHHFVRELAHTVCKKLMRKSHMMLKRERI